MECTGEKGSLIITVVGRGGSREHIADELPSGLRLHHTQLVCHQGTEGRIPQANSTIGGLDESAAFRPDQ